MKKLLGFMSYGYGFTRAWPGELRLISAPVGQYPPLAVPPQSQGQKAHLCRLPGLIQGLQQLLYLFRSYFITVL